MKTAPLRLGVFVAVLIGAGAGCGRHAVRTLPALMVPSPPAHEPAPDEAPPPIEGKLGASTHPSRQSARSSAQQSGPHSAPMLGVIGRDSVPQATGGSVVITTPRSPAPHPSDPSEAGDATSSARAANVPRGDRGIAFAFLIAGVLIGAIKLVPRWTDRV